MENNGKKRFIKYGEKGSGDLFFWLPVKNAPPVAGYIEVKSEVGRPTPAQEVFRQECEFLNILYIVARSITDVDRGITEYLDRFHLTAN